MDPVFLFFLSGAALLGGGGMLWQLVLSPEARLKRALRKAPALPIAQVQDGQVARIVGRLTYDPSAAPLEAPLSGRTCALYEVKVLERRSTGMNTYHWSIVIEECDHCGTFFVDDGSGRALVEVVLPRVAVVDDAHLRSGVLADPSEHCKALLARHGQSSEGLFFKRTLRYTEGVFEEGETVAVRGRCYWEPDPDPQRQSGAAGYRERPLRLRIVSPEPEHLALSDDPSCL